MATAKKSSQVDDLVYRPKTKEQRDAALAAFGGQSSGAMSSAERAARQQAKEMKDQKANTKAYDAAVSSYKSGGMVKSTPKATPYKCGGKVK